jgi:hypothetical protein
MAVWFTVQLDDRPGAPARLASALGGRSVNISVADVRRGRAARG